MNENKTVKQTGGASGKSRRGRYFLGGAVVLVVALVGGPWVYINLIKEDAPAKLTVDSLDTLAAATDATTDATAAADESAASSVAAISETSASSDTSETSNGTDSAAAVASTSSDMTGSWTVTQPSTAGYRVKEILFGQSTQGVGRTSGVAGTFKIDGTSLTEGTFSVDLTTLKSDADRRDSQVQSRLLETATNPTATFKVEGPVALPETPAVGDSVTVELPGTLSLHGVEKELTISLTVKRTAGGFQAAGNTDIVFADFGIEDPSNPAVQTENHGLLELAMTLVKA